MGAARSFGNASHCTSSFSTLASVHCAAATENFIALEHHFTDVPFWNDFVDGLPKPIIQGGYITVPEAPGLGISLPGPPGGGR